MDDYESIDPTQFSSTAEMRLLKFFKATAEGNIEEMSSIIEKGWAKVNDQSPKKLQPALHVACRVGNLASLNFLIEHGADLNLEDARRKHSLHVAVCAVNDNNDEVIKILIEKGASVHKIDKYGRSCLHWAAATGNLANVKLLIATGSAVVFPKVGNWQPIHEAVKVGNLEIATYLVEHGCLDHELLIKPNSTPLHVAARQGHHECVDLLLNKGVDVDCVNNGLQTPLHEASFSGSAKAIRSLLRAGATVNALDNLDRTPLLQACNRGNIEAAQILLDSGGIVTHDDHLCDNSLHHLLRHGSVNLTEGAMHVFIDLLLQYGVSAVHKGSEDKTPLMIALANLNEVITRIIYASMDHPQTLKHAAKIKIRRSIGFEYDNITKTPLPSALQSYVLASEPYYASFLD